ncbi:TOPRIM nucleotidyl transferase/hydrolase domain-containing protein [Deinococcus soli (ex Cha et al. 2016)]|uniref:TOPRIM nucleotidyl transferase/hydrolase domain-containing protein n=1 Tax=Deinococcus soli (ex Cha et al. 2016) TaxID=1309411 RepID=UPI0012FEC2FB|nr:ATP-dependent endonuclease [Deinococcus soli (ex Cha et al. 2016)]
MSDADVSSSIISARRTSNGTKAKIVSFKDFKNLFIYSYQSEIFFADKVIICEGYDAFLIRAVSELYYPSKIDTSNISIVSVQGKDQISEFAKLLLSLDIPCFILADFDYLLRGASEDRLVYGAKAHRSAESVPSGFFKQRLEKPIGDKIFSRIQKFRAHVKRSNAEQFYKAKGIQSLIDSNTTNRDHFEHFRSALESAGMFVLDSEVESLFQDNSIINIDNGKKFDSNAVFELHSLLSSGRQISEYLHCEPLRRMIQQVILA